MSYIDMVEGIPLGLLRACHEGNWNLHLHAVRSLIPWCFAYDKLNYARYMSPYCARMTNLPEKNPRVYESFNAGQFSVQMSKNNPFGRIPVDRATKVTVNKDTQTPGCTARFSLKSGFIKRYYITSKYCRAFLGQLRDMVQRNRCLPHRTTAAKNSQRLGCHVYSGWSHKRLGQPICGGAGPHQHFYCKDSEETLLQRSTGWI